MYENIPHYHKCHLCGAMWSHIKARGVTSDEYHELHNCPTPYCDGNQRWIHHYAGDVEEYPGQWEAEHQRQNSRNPGGGGGGKKNRSEEDEIEEFVESLLRTMARGVP